MYLGNTKMNDSQEYKYRRLINLILKCNVAIVVAFIVAAIVHLSDGDTFSFVLFVELASICVILTLALCYRVRKLISRCESYQDNEVSQNRRNLSSSYLLDESSGSADRFRDVLKRSRSILGIAMMLFTISVGPLILAVSINNEFTRFSENLKIATLHSLICYVGAFSCVAMLYRYLGQLSKLENNSFEERRETVTELCTDDDNHDSHSD